MRLSETTCWPWPLVLSDALKRPTGYHYLRQFPKLDDAAAEDRDEPWNRFNAGVTCAE